MTLSILKPKLSLLIFIAQKVRCRFVIRLLTSDDVVKSDFFFSGPSKNQLDFNSWVIAT